MSGRAGRRGLDERGIVIMIVDEKLEPEVGKSLLKVSALTLKCLCFQRVGLLEIDFTLYLFNSLI